MNVSKYLEVVPLPSICTGTQDEHYKEMEYFPVRESCDNSASTKQVWDKCEELLTEEDIEMRKASPISENVSLEMNVWK